MGEANPATRPLSEVRVGDVARLRKAHPCGGFEWSIVRVGTDIGLECRNCTREISLSLEEFARRCVLLNPSIELQSPPL